MRTCDFCASEPAAWMHSLDPSKSQFRVYGKGHVWANEIALGDACELLYRAGDDDALVVARTRDGSLSAADIDEEMRKPLAVFRVADTGAKSMAEWRPPGAARLIAKGFTPPDELTGADEIIAEWPEAYRRGVPETRPNLAGLTDDDTYWLVRSPWPAVLVEDVIALLWQWQEARQPNRSGRVTDDDRAREAAAREQFFALDEASIQELLRALP